jgi:hypothetical protein
MQQNNSVYWSSRSAQHVSEKTMSIITSVRLQITACGMVSCCSGGLAVRRAAAWSYVLGVKEDTWLFNHLVGFDFTELPTLKMHGQTQIKLKVRMSCLRSYQTPNQLIMEQKLWDNIQNNEIKH